MKKILTLNLLRAVALAVVLGGAAGSLSLMFHAGRNNKSVLLLVLFAIWVLSPFIALLMVNVVSGSWSVVIRVTLYSLMLLVALGSLVGYSGVLSPPGTKPAFVFLVIPLVSWLLIGIFILAAAALSRKLSGRSDKV